MHNRRITTAWTQGLRGEEKEEFESLVRNNVLLLEKLRQIIENEELRIYNSEGDEVSYKDNDWAYLQAHRNGQKQMLRFLKKLTDHLE